MGQQITIIHKKKFINQLKVIRKIGGSTSTKIPQKQEILASLL